MNQTSTPIETIRKIADNLIGFYQGRGENNRAGSVATFLGLIEKELSSETAPTEAGREPDIFGAVTRSFDKKYETPRESAFHALWAAWKKYEDNETTIEHLGHLFRLHAPAVIDSLRPSPSRDAVPSSATPPTEDDPFCWHRDGVQFSFAENLPGPGWKPLYAAPLSATLRHVGQVKHSMANDGKSGHVVWWESPASMPDDSPIYVIEGR
jgi:hypothetical protein